MATTPNGTTYNPHVFSTANGGTGQWFMDDTKTDYTGIPTILYTHGSGGTFEQFYTLFAWRGIRNWLMDNGWAVIEASGGGANWGNQASRDGYMQAFEHADSVLDIGEVNVLGRSMGGLVAYWLAAQSPIADRVERLIINSGTTDLAFRVTDGDPNGISTIMNAHEASTLAEFYQIAAPYDPMQFPVEDWAGRRVLQMWGTDDTSVESKHHAEPWVTKYSEQVAELRTDIRDGGDHSAGNGSYLQTSAMTSFLLSQPPGDPSGHQESSRIIRVYLAGNSGQLFTVQPRDIFGN